MPLIVEVLDGLVVDERVDGAGGGLALSTVLQTAIPGRAGLRRREAEEGQRRRGGGLALSTVLHTSRQWAWEDRVLEWRRRPCSLRGSAGIKENDQEASKVGLMPRRPLRPPPQLSLLPLTCALRNCVRHEVTDSVKPV